MENTKDLEPKQERIISLNQEFHPFDPTYTEEKKIYRNSPPRILTNIILDLGAFKLSLKIDADPEDDLPKTNTITPFNPDDGYMITNEDFDLEKRKQKKVPLIDPVTGFAEVIDFLKNPFCLNIDTPGYDLERSGSVSPELLSILERLKVQVSVGQGNFESRYFVHELLFFDNFYPHDTGPLPEDMDSGLEEGFNLALPNDPEKLATIRMKFVLAEDPPEEAAAKKADQPL